MRLSFFASVKLTIPLIVAIALTVLIGAWCPQESQGGFEKVVEVFGADMAGRLRSGGITDVFHTPFFLFLIAMLTVNMIACSFQRVFPKVRQLKHKMPFMKGKEVSKCPVNFIAGLKAPAQEVTTQVQSLLKKAGYTVDVKDTQLVAEWGKWGRLAATVTHIGLLTLMAGVTITSWTGFSGFKPVPLSAVMTFGDSEHSKQWIGKLPDWKVRVDATRREDYESGDAKQWYSTLSVLDNQTNKVLKTQEISVNNPLSYDGVDIYQSSWGLDSVVVSFNDKLTKLPLRQMGGTNAAMMPLDQTTMLIFSLRGQDKPMRVFAKIPEWQQPKMLAEIPKGRGAMFGEVQVGYVDVVPVTGLQYKSDPGLWLTYTAFGFIMCGVLMAAIPHRQLWTCVAELDQGSSVLYAGGVSRKAKRAFEKNVEKMVEKLKLQYGQVDLPESPENVDAALAPASDAAPETALEAADDGSGLVSTVRS